MLHCALFTIRLRYISPAEFLTLQTISLEIEPVSKEDIAYLLYVIKRYLFLNYVQVYIHITIFQDVLTCARTFILPHCI